MTRNRKKTVMNISKEKISEKKKKKKKSKRKLQIFKGRLKNALHFYKQIHF